MTTQSAINIYIKVTFENKDILTLRLVKDAKYYKLNEGDHLELCYGEYEIPPSGTIDDSYYSAMGAEYFKPSDIALALRAFSERFLSDHPEKSINLGSCLEDIHGKEENTGEPDETMAGRLNYIFSR